MELKTGSEFINKVISSYFISPSVIRIQFDKNLPVLRAVVKHKNNVNENGERETFKLLPKVEDANS